MLSKLIVEILQEEFFVDEDAFSTFRNEWYWRGAFRLVEQNRVQTLEINSNPNCNCCFCNCPCTKTFKSNKPPI